MICSSCGKEPNDSVIHRYICNICHVTFLVPCGTPIPMKHSVMWHATEDHAQAFEGIER